MSNKMRPWTVSFDHAAIATREPEKLKRVLTIIGLNDEGVESVVSQGVKTHFLRPDASHACVEILEVTDPQGVVAKYLDRRGAGIHHISFMVTGLEALCEELRRQSVRLVYEQPRTGAHQMKVNFVHPESTGGILLEVSEKIKEL